MIIYLIYKAKSTLRWVKMVNIPKLILNAGLQLLRPSEQIVDWRQVVLNAANVSDAKFWPEDEKRGLSSMYAEFTDESIPEIAETYRASIWAN